MIKQKKEFLNYDENITMYLSIYIFIDLFCQYIFKLDNK